MSVVWASKSFVGLILCCGMSLDWDQGFLTTTELKDGSLAAAGCVRMFMESCRSQKRPRACKRSKQTTCRLLSPKP